MAGEGAPKINPEAEPTPAPTAEIIDVEPIPVPDPNVAPSPDATPNPDINPNPDVASNPGDPEVDHNPGPTDEASEIARILGERGMLGSENKVSVIAADTTENKEQLAYMQGYAEAEAQRKEAIKPLTELIQGGVRAAARQSGVARTLGQLAKGAGKAAWQNMTRVSRVNKAEAKARDAMELTGSIDAEHNGVGDKLALERAKQGLMQSGELRDFYIAKEAGETIEGASDEQRDKVLARVNQLATDLSEAEDPAEVMAAYKEEITEWRKSGELVDGKTKEGRTGVDNLVELGESVQALVEAGIAIEKIDEYFGNNLELSVGKLNVVETSERMNDAQALEQNIARRLTMATGSAALAGLASFAIGKASGKAARLFGMGVGGAMYFGQRSRGHAVAKTELNKAELSENESADASQLSAFHETLQSFTDSEGNLREDLSEENRQMAEAMQAHIEKVEKKLGGKQAYGNFAAKVATRRMEALFNDEGELVNAEEAQQLYAEVYARLAVATGRNGDGKKSEGARIGIISYGKEDQQQKKNQMLDTFARLQDALKDGEGNLPAEILELRGQAANELLEKVQADEHGYLKVEMKATAIGAIGGGFAGALVGELGEITGINEGVAAVAGEVTKPLQGAADAVRGVSAGVSGESAPGNGPDLNSLDAPDYTNVNVNMELTDAGGYNITDPETGELLAENIHIDPDTGLPNGEELAAAGFTEDLEMRHELELEGNNTAEVRQPVSEYLEEQVELEESPVQRIGNIDTSGVDSSDIFISNPKGGQLSETSGEYVIKVAGENLEGKQLVLQPSAETPEAAFVLDIDEKGEVHIPTDSDAGNSLFTKVESGEVQYLGARQLVAEVSESGEVTAYAEGASGSGVGEIRSYDKLPSWHTEFTNEAGRRISFETPEYRMEPGNLVKGEILGETEMVRNMDGTAFELHRVAAPEVYDQAANPANLTGGVELAPTIETAGKSSGQILQDVLQNNLPQSPEAITAWQTALGGREDIHSMADLNAAADRLTDAVDYRSEAQAEMDDIFQRLEGSNVEIVNAAERPYSVTTYGYGEDVTVVSQHNFNGNNGTLMIPRDQVTGRSLFDTPSMREVLGVSQDAAGEVAYRVECGQFVFIPDQSTPEVLENVTETTTSPATMASSDDSTSEEPEPETNTEEPNTEEPEPETDEPEPETEEPESQEPEPETEEPGESEQPEEPEEPEEPEQPEHPEEPGEPEQPIPEEPEQPEPGEPTPEVEPKTDNTHAWLDETQPSPVEPLPVTPPPAPEETYVEAPASSAPEAATERVTGTGETLAEARTPEQAAAVENPASAEPNTPAPTTAAGQAAEDEELARIFRENSGRR